MPTLSIFFGIIVRMWHDDHPPPHIHVDRSCKTTGSAHSALSLWSAYKELTVIKVLNFRHTEPWKLELEFSDHTHGLFDAKTYLADRQGPLLEPLKDPAYFRRVFVDAGALCWPNGLDLSPARLRELASSEVGV